MVLDESIALSAHFCLLNQDLVALFTSLLPPLIPTRVPLRPEEQYQLTHMCSSFQVSKSARVLPNISKQLFDRFLSGYLQQQVKSALVLHHSPNPEFDGISLTVVLGKNN